MMVYLLGKSSSLKRALVATLSHPEIQRSLIWRAFAGQRSSGRVIMEVSFFMASAGCPLVDFAIYLNYVWGLQNGIAQDDAGHTRKLPKMRDGDHKSPSTMTRTTLNTSSNFQCQVARDLPVHLLIWLSCTQKTKTAPDLIMVFRSESFSRRVMQGMIPCRAAWMRRRALTVVST